MGACRPLPRCHRGNPADFVPGEKTIFFDDFTDMTAGEPPRLKPLIEGHTDGVGNATHNLDLSKRRAEAVKAVLVSQFNVDASRLTTNGLGSTKPMDTNDTPQGRAQNRRVEFSKQ